MAHPSPQETTPTKVGIPVCLFGAKCSGSKGLKTGVFCWCLGGLSNASRAPGIPNLRISLDMDGTHNFDHFHSDRA